MDLRWRSGLLSRDGSEQLGNGRLRSPNPIMLSPGLALKGPIKLSMPQK